MRLLKIIFGEIHGLPFFYRLFSREPFFATESNNTDFYFYGYKTLHLGYYEKNTACHFFTDYIQKSCFFKFFFRYEIYCTNGSCRVRRKNQNRCVSSCIALKKQLRAKQKPLANCRHHVFCRCRPTSSL